MYINKTFCNKHTFIHYSLTSTIENVVFYSHLPIVKKNPEVNSDQF